MDCSQTYSILRFFSGDTPTEVIATGLSHDEAKDHCNRDDTRGTLSTGEQWFDGMEAEQ